MTNVMPGLAAAVWVWQVLLGIALLGTASSTTFLFLLFAAALRYRREARASQAAAVSTPESSLPPVTILKPIHGMEPRLEENLNSFFLQDYPEFEIIIGARAADDLGLEVAE